MEDAVAPVQRRAVLPARRHAVDRSEVANRIILLVVLAAQGYYLLYFFAFIFMKNAIVMS